MTSSEEHRLDDVLMQFVVLITFSWHFIMISFKYNFDFHLSWVLLTVDKYHVEEIG